MARKCRLLSQASCMPLRQHRCAMRVSDITGLEVSFTEVAGQPYRGAKCC